MTVGDGPPRLDDPTSGLTGGRGAPMMRPASPIVPVWRPAVRTTDDAQATVTLDPVNQQGRTVSVALRLEVTFTLPPQDEHLPHAIEAHVHRAGLEAQRALFRALIEHA